VAGGGYGMGVPESKSINLMGNWGVFAINLMVFVDAALFL